MELFSPEKRKPQEHLIVAFQYLQGACRKDGDKLFVVPYGNRTRSNGLKLKKYRVRLDIRKKLFYSESGEALE